MVSRSLWGSFLFLNIFSWLFFDTNSNFWRGSAMDPTASVLPPEEFWGPNRRGHRLHLRHVEPSDRKSKAVLLWLHGYGFHSNLERMWKKVGDISESLNAVIIACDLEGHGYSEGPQTIENCEDLVQDVVDLCMYLFTQDHEPGWKQSLRHLPTFLGGESFGGAIALQAALRGTQLRGLMLAAPFLAEPSLSPTLLSRGLRYAVQKVPQLGQAVVPQIFLPKHEGNQVFSDALDVRDFNADRRGRTPGALGFHHLPMSATTAAALIGMIQSLPGKMAQLELPFLVLHDPDDAITPVNGTELLMKLAKSSYKEFVPVPHGLHAPHFNQMEFCEPKIRNFMLNAINLTPDPPPVGRDASFHSTQRVPTAAERWPAENRVAPQLNVCFLVGHLLMVGSPLLLFVGRFTWLLAALVLIYALLGSFFLLEALRFVGRLQRAKRRWQMPNPNIFECQVRHLVCVAICKEPDAMLLSTLRQLNESPSAPRMRVVFAMEEATDRPLERFELYRRQLSQVSAVAYYVHPVKEGEVRGLCSSLAYSLAQEVNMMNPKDLERHVLTKVDSQVLLPLNYFQELEWSLQRSQCPVVWQPILAGLLNRPRTIGATRALTAMRCFSYPGLFAMNLMCVTCYSVRLDHYRSMGFHHPNYLAEDCMMLAQGHLTHGPGQLQVLPVVVAVAPPLDESCCGALVEAARQAARWAGQVAEVAEFRWRYRQPGTTCGTSWWLFRYWLVRLALINGIGLFASSLSLAGSLAPEVSDFSDLEVTMIFWMDKLMLIVLVALLLIMPLYEQLLAHFFISSSPQQMPWYQLPLTMISAPLAISTNTVVDLWAWYRLLFLGKDGVVIRQRKKLSLNQPKDHRVEVKAACDDTFYC